MRVGCCKLDDAGLSEDTPHKCTSAAQSTCPCVSGAQVTLARKWPGLEYTFVLAGFLKIMTLGYIASSAPAECVRTSFGEHHEPCDVHLIPTC